MGKEIERKFLVKDSSFKMEESVKAMRITQGYLSSVPERAVRIRISDHQGFITIKGIGDKSGASRYEWEKKIPEKEAEELLKICEPGVIDKTRYNVQLGKHKFEIDEFHGDNEGLIVAELELKSKDEFFEKPQWLGKEVTGDVKYYNAMLKKNPFKKW
ncbi:CYTH domain-containing protein [Aureibaculum algae]|uniref:CYTH domain-containing protein n=1 Tax=Aureibaculum algae TaxID=2584122 RepID=A0A5B7TXT6_9FLAO|nr:CYTH domain-containing protein [Aureibaculum algae]QCX40144.1 CYTH domain-containing protein [Aureibaculum algae]